MDCIQDLPFATMLASCYGCVASELLSTLKEHQAKHSECYKEIVARVSHIQASKNSLCSAGLFQPSR
jgi:hypothetical protein